MSRKASPYVSLLLCVALILCAECASSIPDRCLELARFDVDEIETYLSELNFTDVPTVKMMTAGFKCPISALPFGTLKSDWARLLLLQEAQPDGSIVKLKLVRLMRILIIAYYQMEERIDVMEPETKIAKKPLVGETMTTVSATNETSQMQRSNSSNSLGAETSSDNAHCRCSCMDSFPNDVARLATESDCSRIKSDATEIEIATMKNLSSPDGTTTVVPPTATRQNVTSSIDLGAATTYYPGSAKKAAFRILGNCLKQSLKDLARQRPSSKVFEIVKNKAKYTAALKGNEIDDRGGDRAVIRMSPPMNEFWRYVMLPTRAPLTVASNAPAYRMRGLSGFRTDPRRSRKNARLNSDIYESFRRFYGVDKNERGYKVNISPRIPHEIVKELSSPRTVVALCSLSNTRDCVLQNMMNSYGRYGV